jgi:thioredoxin-related protein
MRLTKWSGWMFLGFMLLAVTSRAAEIRDPNRFFFDQSFGNLQDEVAEARKEHKLGILVMFETADCPWCEKMMATVLNQADVQDYYRKYFRAIQVDTNGDLPLVNFSGKEMTQKDFAFGHNRVRATPVFAFFDLQGELMTKYTGATKDASEFLWLGEFVVTGAYKQGNFTTYKRERQAAAKK